MSNMSFGLWVEYSRPSCYVAPKKKYTKEQFESECVEDGDGYYDFEDTKEGWARFLPVAPEGVEIDGGCYSLCNEGKGAFPVWIREVKVRQT